ncbi:Hypothetical Protein FCC1311_090612 [Hondaea fermentalgiana]|uniref:Uncharacterized protein n=1 Tax=Hondaea fermentalgiana TaxID=2315210 RepID=A0A2R5GPN1_9STRA|nr:Hypothetical Protein FCC1311_090612 [Hondaea fermentalgiana]|eukprot:GBG32836.1 Hypothetical Protein FCC1311_090612 [Hondaea fermentalgiana]
MNEHADGEDSTLVMALELAPLDDSPFKFPYKATLDEMLNDAVDFLADEDPHFDEDEEYSQHATWMIANRLHQYYAEHDLVGFSESVYAYMLRTFCRFGVLSTTNITWFMKLEPDNTLKITNGYDCTGNTEATNPKYAYFRLLLKASKGSVAADVSGGGAAGRAPSDGSDEARLNFLRQTLPLDQSVFPYYGGVKDLLWEDSDACVHLMSVNSGGLEQLIAVKTPEVDPYRERDDETEQEEMRLLQAFTNEIEVYETLRPLWGSRFVPWFLYGGRHLFSDFIVAITWEGKSLKSHFRKPSQYTKAVVDKAQETLLMVHGLGVALRVDEPEDLASTFVMDDHGEVRLTRFRNATIKATPVELAQDIQYFNEHFILE